MTDKTLEAVVKAIAKAMLREGHTLGEIAQAAIDAMPGWQPIDDMPREIRLNETEILCGFYDKIGRWHQDTATWNKAKGMWDWWVYRGSFPTHYQQPLPAPPPPQEAEE
tara:strand:+ start:2895 stop:3221 length:327 start_codon:yes stop_codon:yes gene_type:complete